MSTTVLVTGRAGSIGSHKVHDLVDADGRVVVLANLMTGLDTPALRGTDSSLPL